MKNLRFISLEDVLAVMKAKKFKIFEEEGIPNIVGIRSLEKDGEDFDDICYVWWKLPNGNQEVHLYTITTNPGKYYLNKPLPGTSGAAILVSGQYLGCWILGSHGKSQQYALIQRGGEVRVYRDKNLDSKLDCDPATIDKGFFGINLHHGSKTDVDIIGKWSAGCQVWRYHQPHQDLMQKFKALSERYKFTKFSYTLLEQTDF